MKNGTTNFRLLFEKETGNKEPNIIDGVSYDEWEDKYVYWLEEKLERETRRTEIYKRLAQTRGNLFQRILQRMQDQYRWTDEEVKTAYNAGWGNAVDWEEERGLIPERTAEQWIEQYKQSPKENG